MRPNSRWGRSSSRVSTNKSITACGTTNWMTPARRSRSPVSASVRIAIGSMTALQNRRTRQNRALSVLRPAYPSSTRCAPSLVGCGQAMPRKRFFTSAGVLRQHAQEVGRTRWQLWNGVAWGLEAIQYRLRAAQRGADDEVVVVRAAVEPRADGVARRRDARAEVHGGWTEAHVEARGMGLVVGEGGRRDGPAVARAAAKVMGGRRGCPRRVWVRS